MGNDYELSRAAFLGLCIFYVKLEQNKLCVVVIGIVVHDCGRSLQSKLLGELVEGQVVHGGLKYATSMFSLNAFRVVIPKTPLFVRDTSKQSVKTQIASSFLVVALIHFFTHFEKGGQRRLYQNGVPVQVMLLTK